MQRKWIQKGYDTGFNPDIPYDNDFVCNHFIWRLYEWYEAQEWSKCSRLFLVGDSDVIYDENGKSTTFENSTLKTQYYVIDPTLMECDSSTKKATLRYFMVRGIGEIAKPIPINRLRFVGVPLKFVSPDKHVTYDFVFDLLEDVIGMGIYSETGLFEASQARAVYAYLYSKLDLPSVVPETSDTDTLFHYYNVLHQFSEKYEKTASNPDRYNTKNYTKALVLKKGRTNAEKESLVSQYNTKAAKKEPTSEGIFAKLEGKLEELEKDPAVKKFAKLYDDVAKIQESVEQGKNVAKNEKRIRGIEVKMVETEKPKTWKKIMNQYEESIHHDIQKKQSKYQTTLPIEYMKEKLENAIQENVMLILTEFLPELEEEYDDEEIEMEEGSITEEGEASEGDYSTEEDEGYDVESDSEEEVGEEIVEWDESGEEVEDSASSADDSEEDFEEESEGEIKRLKPTKVADWADEGESEEEEDDDFEGGSEDDSEEGSEED